MTPAPANNRVAFDVHAQDARKIDGAHVYPLKTEAGDLAGFVTRPNVALLAMAPRMLDRLETIYRAIQVEGGRGMFSAEEVAALERLIVAAGGNLS